MIEVYQLKGVNMHRFLSADENLVSCLICGGTWEDTPEGDAVSFKGEYAVRCSGNTAQCHHYSNECPEEVCSADPECNCLHCDS